MRRSSKKHRHVNMYSVYVLQFYGFIWFIDEMPFGSAKSRHIGRVHTCRGHKQALVVSHCHRPVGRRRRHIIFNATLLWATSFLNNRSFARRRAPHRNGRIFANVFYNNNGQNGDEESRWAETHWPTTISDFMRLNHTLQCIDWKWCVPHRCLHIIFEFVEHHF